MRGPSRSRCRCQADTRSTAQGTSIDDESRIIYTCHAALAVSAEHVASAGSPGALALAGELLGGREPDGSLVAMLPSHRSSSPEVAALRVATEGICKQLRVQAREHARLFLSAAAAHLPMAVDGLQVTHLAAAHHTLQ